MRDSVRSYALFQPTLLCEERRAKMRLPSFVTNFNPRSCARSDTTLVPLSLADANFNPRSCARSDSAAHVAALYGVISTHAPVRGATCPGRLDVHTLVNFNPRSCARSDSLLVLSTLSNSYFNPRSCARSDPAECSQPSRVRFQPTLLCEERPGRTPLCFAHLLFQPTLLCEERRQDRDAVFGQDDFNPRSCARSDDAPVSSATVQVISTHAPVRGATALAASTCIHSSISTHAPVRGATATNTFGGLLY